jgi:hypothetical protein
MPTATPPLSERIASALRGLGERPLCLFFTLLTANALVFPYAGFAHDARLYGAQVLNRLEGGSFSDDLFFRFGSQDQYSIFSQATAPVIGWLGLPTGFFILYLVCNAALIMATQRLIRLLIDDKLLSTVALLLMIVMPLCFSGFHIFHVFEPFLTPRILANAMVIFGLEQMLRGRSVVALALCLAAGLMHPLMAAGGVAVVAGWLILQYLPRWVMGAAIATGAVGGLVLLVDPNLGSRLFGQMDDEWLKHVLVASPYNFPAEWSRWDWTQLILTLAVALAAALGLAPSQPSVARFAASVFIVAAGGLAATTLASFQGYTILFQGQPYRALWIAKLLEPSLALLLASALWRTGDERRRILALGLLGALGITTLLPIELIFPLFFLPVAMLACRGLDKMPRRSDWLSRSVAISLVLGFVGWAGYRVWLNLLFADVILEHTTLYFFALILVGSLGPVVWMLGIGMVLARVHGGMGFSQRFVWTTVAIMMAAQLASFGIPRAAPLKEIVDRHYHDQVFVEDFLKQHALGPSRPTVYWSGGSIDRLWLELGVLCYYERLQIQGVLFSRQTAIEGQRRALVVRQFELARLQEEKALLSDRWRELLEGLYQQSLDAACPTEADLRRLCREPGIDYVIVKECFPGLYAASNGKLFIYDCKQVVAAAFRPDGERAEAAPNPIANYSSSRRKSQ